MNLFVCWKYMKDLDVIRYLNGLMDFTWIEPNEIGSGIKWKNFRNVITWDISDYDWLPKNANTLYLANGILNRKMLFIDNMGLKNQSFIVQNGLNTKPLNEDQKRMVRNWIFEDFPAFRGYKEDGKILIALQSNTSFLSEIARFLPKNHKIEIRPHPACKAKKEYMESIHHYCNQFNWHLDDSDNLNVSLFDSRAVITENSSIAYISMAMGIPVATLKHGLYSCSDTTLECVYSKAKIKKILDYYPNFEHVYSLLFAIYDNAIPIIADQSEFVKNKHIKKWFNIAR